MIVYQTDKEGLLVGQVQADPDPLNDGSWLIPGGCTPIAPPTLTSGQNAKLLNGVWLVIEPEVVIVPDPPTEAELLALERATMTCTPMQGILTLGEVEWNKVLTYKATATWAEGVIIDSAKDWKRLSQNIAFFQYLLGYTDAQVDNLFRQAALVEA